MRSFVVAAWERSRERRRDLKLVEADTAEHAIEQVAGDLPEDEQGGTYEAWPRQEPNNVLRMVFQGRRSRRGAG
jgi:hypothetical protein